MFRNQYDNDVTVWSPQGRIHQVEYAMEAVKQGSATCGVKSKDHAVLVALKRASSDLAAHQKKVMPIDTHIAVSISGLTADARVLCRYMRTECLNEHFSHNQALGVNKLMDRVGSKMQIATQRYDKRPYGVGLLLAGYDINMLCRQQCLSTVYYALLKRNLLERKVNPMTSTPRDRSTLYLPNLVLGLTSRETADLTKNHNVVKIKEIPKVLIYYDKIVVTFTLALTRIGGSSSPRQ
ncbi:unnamed protein product, partial [Meganyctiphanes norvegica]